MRRGWGPISQPCPVCGAHKVVAIVHGYPGEDLSQAAERGEVVLGGCCGWFDGTDASHACLSCGEELHRFGRRFFRQQDWIAPVAIRTGDDARILVQLRTAAGRTVELAIGPRSSASSCFGRMLAEHRGGRA